MGACALVDGHRSIGRVVQPRQARVEEGKRVGMPARTPALRLVLEVGMMAAIVALTHLVLASAV